MNRLVQYSMKLSFAGAVAVALLALGGISVFAPALADHESGHDEIARGKIGALEERVWSCENDFSPCKSTVGLQGEDGPAGDVGPPGIQGGTGVDGVDGPLEGLICQDGQTVAFNGTSGQWECAAAGGGGAHPDMIVFTTSTVTDGSMSFEDPNENLTGIDAATDECNRLAENEGLPGTYLPWLSDETFSPANVFTQSPGQYILLPLGHVETDVLAYNWDDLTDRSINQRIATDEKGSFDVVLRSVWTATSFAGEWVDFERRQDDCEGWTSKADDVLGWVGNPHDRSDAAWTLVGESFCNTLMPIYCFQQPQ